MQIAFSSVLKPSVQRLASRSALGFTRPHARAAPRAAPKRTMYAAGIFGAAAAPGSKFYDFKVNDIDGSEVPLDKFKGQVVLVVNLASKCGFTPQYTDLQALYDKYSSRNFTILGFPCNQFGSQEPGSNAEVKKFAMGNYNVKFPLMSKVDVNGSGADPVFNFLKSEKGGLLGNDIKWNFTKFLVDKEGNVVGRYGSTTTPEQISKDIEKYL